MAMVNVTLRPVTAADLTVLTGDESEFTDFGPRERRTDVPAPDIDASGGLTIATPTVAVAGYISWRWVAWGPNPESRSPMIGVWLRRDYRGQGIGTAAQRRIAELFFERTSTNRVEAHTDVDNIVEQRALETAGFTREGMTRGAQWRRGSYHDGYLYAVLRSELTAARTP